jgi:hypothetical protein
LRNKKITVILLASVVMITFAVVVAATPMGQVPVSAVNQGTNDGTAARVEGQQGLIVRSDLTGSGGPFLVGQPLFMQLSNGSTNSAALSDILYIDGANPSDVQVRTLGPDGLSPSWGPVGDARGVHGALPGSGNGTTSVVENSTLIMISFNRAGDFSLEAACNSMDGPISVSTKVNVSVTEAAYLFDMPRLGDGSAGGWVASLAKGEEMNFTISAPTTTLWHETEKWTSFYNWTLSVINPEGMVVGGDLTKYNTGALNLDKVDLERTSVVSSWESGFNSAFYTGWAGEGGTRLTGNAAMTPNGKQLTYGGGVWDAWTKGVWQPEGIGHLTFHQAGHYLFVFTLTKNGQVVSPPLVQEVAVH